MVNDISSRNRNWILAVWASVTPLNSILCALRLPLWSLRESIYPRSQHIGSFSLSLWYFLVLNTLLFPSPLRIATFYISGSVRFQNLSFSLKSKTVGRVYDLHRDRTALTRIQQARERVLTLLKLSVILRQRYSPLNNVQIDLIKLLSAAFVQMAPHLQGGRYA